MSRSTEPRFAFAVLLYSRRRGGTSGLGRRRAVWLFWRCDFAVVVRIDACESDARGVGGGRQRWSSAVALGAGRQCNSWC